MDELDNEIRKLESIVDGLEKPRRLSLALLRAITDKFSDARIIGQGGCGVVYKGVLRNGTVAVKKLFSNHTIDNKIFYSEVQSMMMVDHKNIVQFLGFCSDTQEDVTKMGEKFVLVETRERLLCFGYINNGSLQKHIKVKPLMLHYWKEPKIPRVKNKAEPNRMNPKFWINVDIILLERNHMFLSRMENNPIIISYGCGVKNVNQSTK